MSELPPNDPTSPISPATPITPTTSTTTTGTSMTPDTADVEKNKIFGILAYFGILVLIPIFAAKESRFARFHANQGLILLITSVIGWIVLVPLSFVLAFVPYVGPCLIPVVMGLFSLAILALVIMGIINAATGKMKQLPVIGKFTILK